MARKGRQGAAPHRNATRRQGPLPRTLSEDRPELANQHSAASSITQTTHEAIWSTTRAGARAGRGFHYQDVVGAWLCGQLLIGRLAADSLVPEGPEDLSCEGQSSWQVQVKSRQEKVGPFSATEVASHVIDLASRHAARENAGLPGRPVLVLERPIGQWIPMQWGAPLADSAGSGEFLQVLGTVGARNGLDQGAVAAIAERVSVVVLPWRAAAEETRAAITSRHNLLPSAADPVVLALREAVAECVDTNAEHDWVRRASLDRTKIARLVADASALVDSQALEEALSSGLCEPVDFDTATEQTNFYEGVDAQPGHIAAGLPAPRPEVTGQVVAGIDSGGTVLVTGPSGVGKSTVMWAAAYAARHVLWFRVRRLREAHVHALVRLARALKPRERTPVGFVVDAVGVGAAEAWDSLQQELAAVPGTVLLGSARTEDLLPLRSLPNCTLVSVRLDEETAAQIHSGLVRTGAVAVPHWREAYNNSGELTLEFTHLLARGRRLSDILTEQVRRRVAEGREAELQILALVTTAHRWSADLSLDAVRGHLDASAPDFRAALARLADEHLIEVRGTRLTGLHQLRSRVMSTAVHGVPPPTVQDTVVTLLGLLDPTQIQPFILGALTDHPELDALVVDRLLSEIRGRTDTAALVPTLQALRLVDFQRRAAHWSDILDANGVQPAHRQITFQLALSGAEALPDCLRPEIAQAIPQIDAHADYSPLCDSLLTQLGPSRVAEALSGCQDLAEAAQLLAAMPEDAPDQACLVEHLAADTPFAKLLHEAPAQQLGNLLAVALRHSASLAQALFDLSGGESSVFDKLHAHSPWLVEVAVIQRDNESVGYARLLHLSDAALPDVDTHTRDFARTLLRCLPMCPSVDVQTLLPGDVPLKFGDVVFGVSLLQRRYDHPPASVTWNRVRSHVAAHAWGPVDATTRASVARQLVVDTHRYLRTMTDAWCLSRGQKSQAVDLEAQRRTLRAKANVLTLPFDRTDLFSALASETPATLGNDHLHTLIDGVVDNLTSRLHAQNPNWASLAAFTGGTLRDSVAQIRDEENWSVIDTDPPDELDEIDTILECLHAILAEMAWGQLPPRRVVAAARAGNYSGALPRTADLARSRAGARVAQHVQELESAAADAGLSVQVWTRHLHDAEGVDWPQMQVAVGVQLPDLTQWEPSLSLLVGLIEHALPSEGRRAPVLLVPLADGRPLRLLARSLVIQVNPGQELCDAWIDEIGPPLPTPLADEVLHAHQALQALSGLAVLAARRDGTDVLQGYADSETTRLQHALGALRGLGTDNDPVVEAIVEFLDDLSDRVQREVDADTQEASTLSAGIARGAVLGQPGDISELNALLLLSLQWDINPDVAAVLVRDTEDS